jgi:hypothetical protein
MRSTLAIFAVLFTADPSLKAQLEQVKADTDRVTAFLQKTFPGKTWDKGPLPVHNEAISQAYPKMRFYHVFTPWPLSGYEGKGVVMTLKEQQAYNLRIAKHIKEKLSKVVGIAADDTVSVYQKESDYDRGLIKIQNDADAKIATAAILSLHLDLSKGLTSWSAKDVTVTSDKDGRKGRTTPDHLKIIWGVNFDAQGKCQGAGMFSPGPPPPP